MTDREPDFVNDQGVKWWLHDGVTNYAKTKMLNVMGWEVETPDGLKNFVLTNADGVVAEAKGLEGIGIKIDMLSMLAKEATI